MKILILNPNRDENMTGEIDNTHMDYQEKFALDSKGRKEKKHERHG